MTEPFEIKAERLNQQIARVEKYFAHTYPGVSAEIQCALSEGTMTLGIRKVDNRWRLCLRLGVAPYGPLANASLDNRLWAAQKLRHLESALRDAARVKYGALDEALDTYKKFASEFHG